LRIHNYEKKAGLIFVITLLIILELIGCIYMKNTKETIYHKIIGIYSKENFITCIVDNSERKLLYDNNVLWIEDKKKKYEIVEDRGIILKRKKKNYYELIIKIKGLKQKETKDTLELSIPMNKINMWKLVHKTWEGDKH